MAKPNDIETVADLLSDPLIRSLMRADHVEAAELAASLNGVAARLRRPERRATFTSVARMAGERPVLALGAPLATSLLVAKSCADVCQNSLGR